MENKKPLRHAIVFSSIEALPLAKELSQYLNNNCPHAFYEIKFKSWDDDFSEGQTLTHSLHKRVSCHDFAICLYTRDVEYTRARNHSGILSDAAPEVGATAAPNVILETGLCWGLLGIDRTFVVAPDKKVLPSDCSIEPFVFGNLTRNEEIINKIAPRIIKKVNTLLNPEHRLAYVVCLRVSGTTAIEAAERLRAWDGVPPDRIQPYAGGAAAIWDETRPFVCDILKTVTDLNNNGQLSIGVALGPLEKRGSDYYGSALDSAACLMNFASPHGLILEKKFADEVCRAKGSLGDLSPRSFFVPDIEARGLTECFATSTVLDWRCLSWPGIESAANAANTDEPVLMTLNPPGITFVTHQGLPGRFENMKLHPRESLGFGKNFELIIDDYDTLLLRHEMELFPIDKCTPPINAIIDDITSILCRRVVAECPFLFVPIRCGLNSIALSKSLDDNLREALHRTNTFAELISLLEVNGLSCGIFDVMGSSMPIMLRAEHPQVADVYASVDPKYPSKALDLLSRLNFRLLPSMRPREVKNTDCAVILGGGGWLLTGDRREQWEIHYPKNDPPFLWVEGAAVNNQVTVRETEALLEFVKKHALAKEFQERLKEIDPYPTCPVTQAGVASCMKNANDETGKIYRWNGDDYEVNDKIRRRMAPAKAMRTRWMEVWDRITERLSL